MPLQVSRLSVQVHTGILTPRVFPLPPFFSLFFLSCSSFFVLLSLLSLAPLFSPALLTLVTSSLLAMLCLLLSFSYLQYKLQPYHGTVMLAVTLLRPLKYNFMYW